MGYPSTRRWMIALVAVAAIFPGAPLALLTIKAQRVAAFENSLSVGLNADALNRIAAAQGVKAGSFYGQPPNVRIFRVSQTWRFGTPCDDVVFEKLIFENGRLERWGEDDTVACM